MKPTIDWRPCASQQALQLRAQLLERLRKFFSEREVLEVDTPILSCAAVTDPHLENFVTQYKFGAKEQAYYLHTSPEFAMKRLLAANSGPIYQLCKVFRQGEAGQHHNPEFTLLEWYRIDMDHHALMDEVETFLSILLRGHSLLQPGLRFSYKEAFIKWAEIDPFSASAKDIYKKCQQHLGNVIGLDGNNSNDGLDLLLSQIIAPRLPSDRPVFIYDFPISQAALAVIRPDVPPVAERFEVFINGIELANGFHELCDAKEQRQRFEKELAQRLATGKTNVPIDELFLQSLTDGLPNCAGVAVGFDRLLMLAMGTTHINDVLSFPINSA